MKLMTGTVLAQALGILVLPIVTRLFAPEAFGIAAIFSSITGIVGVIVCLRYEIAIMLPESHEEAANILGVSLLSVLFMTAISILIICFGSEIIVGLLKAPQLKKYLWLVPIAIFFQGIFLALNYWNTRTRHYGRLSIAQVVSSLTAQVTKLAAGFAGFVSGGVLIGTGILGSIIATGTLSGQIWRDDKRHFLDHIRLKAIGKSFVRYKKFPLIDSWGGLLNSISWQLPALMLSSFFSAAIVGFYALGLAIVKTPLSFISGALSQVFYQKACAEKNVKGNNSALVEKLLEKMIFLGLLPIMLLTMIGEELFAVVFGQKWVDAGLYTQILAPWVFFWFISSPLSSLFSVYERLDAALLVHTVIFVTRVASLYIGGIFNNIYLALFLFSITGIIAYGFVAVWNIHLAKADVKKIAFIFIKYFICFIPICVIIFLVKYIFQCGQIVVLLASSILAVAYLFMFRFRYYTLLKQ